ncbi:RAB11-binding protein RELCH homolog [Xenia sp. Carnegie-2017]|uniref:RAB11-binding protein RELCH homolog n=1 Tax=Xenia sp. Carnegie-2017 TaxID=2897299 RepID=UPI001F03F017|nr:RAB11-binding protein RELCH homolog [Xenia sp. Carnegie-2017]
MAEEQVLSEEAAGYRHLLDVNWIEVANHLIKSRLLLTALELHTELLENGRELPLLRDFFSNPGNFQFESVRPPSPIGFNLARTSSNLTLDSIDDFTRYSDDGLAERGDERIAVLQFELRKAHNTIKSLRGSLTVATEQEGVKAKDCSETSSINEDAIKPHEKRAINFLVNEYLLQSGYRLTSVTFSDENEDQDFDDWDDVGLNIAQPPNLLRLYRDFDKHVMPSAVNSLKKVEEENLRLEEMCKTLNDELEELRKEKEQFLLYKEEMEAKSGNFEEKNSLLLSQISALSEELEQSKKAVRANVTEKNSPTAEVESVANSNDFDAHSESSIKSNTLENGSFHEDQNTKMEDETKERKVHLDSNFKNAILDEKSDDNINLCPSFKKALLNVVGTNQDTRLGLEVMRLTSTEESLVQVLSRCLPHIIPNVLLNKREELIPLIVCTAIHHPDEKERDKLLHSLFNLIKRPDVEHRCMIIAGCSSFSRVVGHMRTEAELLPQLWEQINHKYPERRNLVAEACGTLSQYLPNEIVSSLLLSMLKQMFAEDRNDNVRATVVKTLALVYTIVDSPSKYKEAEELLLQALCDNASEVSESTLNVLLPAVAVWALELDKLQSQLVELILQQLELTLSDFLHIEESRNDEETELESTINVISSRFRLYILALTQCVPALMIDVLSRAPFQTECDALENEFTLPDGRLPIAVSPLTDIAVLFGGTPRLAKYLEFFDRWLKKQNRQTFWETLEWISNKLISRIYGVLGQIHFSQVVWVDCLAELFRNICRVFGHVYTITRLKTYFESEMKVIFHEDAGALSQDEKQQIISSAIIPVYILGILTAFSSVEDQENVQVFIKDTLTSFASQKISTHSLYMVCEKLSSSDVWRDVLLKTSWELLNHDEGCVRCVVPNILQAMVKNLDRTSIMKRVLPTLVTISTDNDKFVRISTVPAFGAIVEHISDDETLEKIHIQFQSFLSDPTYYDQHELQVALIRTFGKIGPHSEPRFRDHFLHPKLTELVLRNAKTGDQSKKTEISIVLLEAYASLTCCFIPEDILRNNTLPGLMYLKQDLATLAPEYEETASLLMKDCEDKLVNQKTTGSTQASSKVQAAEDVKRAILNKFHKLKDASTKPRMSELFRKKSKNDSEKLN